MPLTLKRIPQRYLNDPRGIPGCVDHSEIHTRKRCIRKSPLKVIESVKKVSPDTKPVAFERQCKTLGKCEIHVFYSISKKRISRQNAAAKVSQGRLTKSACLEQLPRRRRIADAAPQNARVENDRPGFANGIKIQVS